jgi:hypothetical protein
MSICKSEDGLWMLRLYLVLYSNNTFNLYLKMNKTWIGDETKDEPTQTTELSSRYFWDFGSLRQGADVNCWHIASLFFPIMNAQTRCGSAAPEKKQSSFLSSACSRKAPSHLSESLSDQCWHPSSLQVNNQFVAFISSFLFWIHHTITHLYTSHMLLSFQLLLRVQWG